MNLYLVTCVSVSCLYEDDLEVYVSAKSASEAEEKALSCMKERGWKWCDYVRNIKLIGRHESRFPMLYLE